MIQKGETLSTGRGTFPSALLFITDVAFMGLGPNQGLRCERPATNRLNRGIALRNKNETGYYMRVHFVPNSKHPASVIKTSQLMLYREIIAVCSQIHTKHINTVCGQNVELLNVKLVVHMVTTGL